jgi:tetratricopeptide (TPR) repeat protein
VQTTCRDWFAIRSGQLNTPGAVALLKQLENRGHEARPLSDVQLLGKVYYNRGVSLLEQQNFSGAVQLLNTAIRLDTHDEPARNNLLAAYNNWSLALCDKQDYAGAIKTLALAREINPQYGPLLTNDLHVHQKWVLHLCDQERYSSALELLEAGFQRRPEAPLFSAGRYAVYGMWMKSHLLASRYTQALSVADSARKIADDTAELIRQEVSAFQSAAEQVVAAGNTKQAKTMLEIGVGRHPTAESLRVLLSRLQ